MRAETELRRLRSGNTGQKHGSKWKHPHVLDVYAGLRKTLSWLTICQMSCVRPPQVAKHSIIHTDKASMSIKIFQTDSRVHVTSGLTWVVLLPQFRYVLFMDAMLNWMEITISHSSDSSSWFCCMLLNSRHHRSIWGLFTFDTRPALVIPFPPTLLPVWETNWFWFPHAFQNKLLTSYVHAVELWGSYFCCWWKDGAQIETWSFYLQLSDGSGSKSINKQSVVDFLLLLLFFPDEIHKFEEGREP